ncbi:MAG: putative prokaryotic signal transducing protein [Acidimicrobiaceae bacterium]|nr:putative prokaryotic signal transducing protein [Acidimicrobiaceae bacterium]
MADPVKLTTVPNGPLAEVVCQRLRADGIEAFYRATSPWGGGVNNSLDPAYPAEIYVHERDLERARKYLPK